jgi:inorganic triphosphatase YgiF
MEIELKLLLAPEDVPRLRAHALLAQYAQAEPQVLAMHDIYVDTPDCSCAATRRACACARWMGAGCRP